MVWMRHFHIAICRVWWKCVGNFFQNVSQCNIMLSTAPHLLVTEHLIPVHVHVCFWRHSAAPTSVLVFLGDVLYPSLYTQSTYNGSYSTNKPLWLGTDMKGANGTSLTRIRKSNCQMFWQLLATWWWHRCRNVWQLFFLILVSEVPFAPFESYSNCTLVERAQSISYTSHRAAVHCIQ